jgi:hypothetical protein
MNFKTHFLEAEHALREQQGTTQAAGYHGANLMIDQENYMHTAEALVNLAMAAMSDHQAFHVSVKANAAQTTTIESLTDEVKKLQEDLAKLKQKKKPDQCPNTSDCWTYGYHIMPNHNSSTCGSKAEGHKDAATHSNTMGGSTAGKE